MFNVFIIHSIVVFQFYDHCDILVYYTNIFAYLIWFDVIADTALNFFLPSGAGD